MKKGDFVVKVISGAGVKTATIQRVESVKKGVVRLVGSNFQWNERDGMEIDPVIAGFNSYLVEFDGGEIEHWAFAETAKAHS